MRKQIQRSGINLIVLAVLLGTSSIPTVSAETSSSTNYQVVETDFGNSSTLESCSVEYCSRSSAGGSSGTAAGSTEGSQNKAEFGPITPNEPMLEMIVDPGVSSLGKFTPEQTSTKTSTIKIRNYLSDGYTVQIVGTPLSYDGHVLTQLGSTNVSTPGVEQFGMNVVSNSVPNIGEDPVQVPSSETSFGEASPGYDMANMFTFNDGDIIARSTKESGRTDYTISMIVNVSTSTPAGAYSGDFSAVVVPVF